jgi:hypothetical protein
VLIPRYIARCKDVLTLRPVSWEPGACRHYGFYRQASTQAMPGPGRPTKTSKLFTSVPQRHISVTRIALTPDGSSSSHTSHLPLVPAVRVQAKSAMVSALSSSLSTLQNGSPPDEASAKDDGKKARNRYEVSVSESTTIPFYPPN